VVPLENVGENFYVNFPGLQFQAQQVSKTTEKVRPNGSFLGKKTARKSRVLVEEKLDEMWVG
jgi:hypothetical protein